MKAIESKKSRAGAAMPRILASIRDQHGSVWICYGKATRYKWVRQSDFLEARIFKSLIDTDSRLLKRSAQNQLLFEVGELPEPPTGLVANAPGWMESRFVHGHFLPGIDPARSNIIPTFEPITKFAPRGDLRAWQDGVANLVRRQRFALFVMSLALAGSLHPFIPSDYISPFFELVGSAGKGKTTMGILAASIWAGDAESNSGGGETWDISPRQIGELKVQHRHMLLLLDEGNLAGTSSNQQADLIKAVAFNVTGSGQRKVKGETNDLPHSYLSVLSTTNLPIFELIGTQSETLTALRQRIITVMVPDRKLGVFDHLPKSSKDSSDAAEQLRNAIDKNYGSAGRAFVESMESRLEDDAAKFRMCVRRRLEQERRRMEALVSEARVQKAFALVATAGWLARKSGVFPRSWGNASKAVRLVARKNYRSVVPRREELSGPREADTAVRSYLRDQGAKVVDLAGMASAHPPDQFAVCPGYLETSNGKHTLYVPTAVFNNALSNAAQILKDAAKSGSLKTERGAQSKLSIKAPKKICKTGRVYCFLLDS